MAKTFKVTVVENDGSRGLSYRCSGCRQIGVLEVLGQDLRLIHDHQPNVYAGHRRCPNEICHTHLFVIHDGQKIIVSYPPETTDFDASSIPNPITRAFEEAISCHANQCFVAAAIMVRKTLEELCRDRGATGANLKERIRALGSRVVLPKELFDGLDDIRLLGNDAAHIESQEYDQIGQEELDVAIEFTKRS